MQCEQQTGTWFAPASRAQPELLARVSRKVRSDAILSAVLEAVPGFAVVVDEHRQIVAANQRFLEGIGERLEHVIGDRPGEAIGCREAMSAPGGCGTNKACAFCGAALMLTAWTTNAATTGECRVPLDPRRGAALDLELLVTPVTVDDHQLAVLAMRDVSADKRRRVLERAFFHDVLNTAGGIMGLAHLMRDEGTDLSLGRDLVEASHQLVDEIRSHQQLLAAEVGELRVDLADVSVPHLLQQLVSTYGRHDVAALKQLQVAEAPSEHLWTDPILLRRVIGNLIKNALEATPTGGRVTVSAREVDDAIVFQVHNPGEIPASVQAQLFLRSFSTKGIGRGVGTYSVKLFAEAYLRGKVTFTTSAADGTSFFVHVPRVYRGDKLGALS